jgi:post-segregation antitoxin (ccd killing protein)
VNAVKRAERTTVVIPLELREEARLHGLNISEIARAAVLEAIVQKRLELLQQARREVA